MDVGQGILDLGMAVNREKAAAKIDYQHRFTEDMAGFLQAEGSYDWATKQLSGQALAGLRIRF